MAKKLARKLQSAGFHSGAESFLHMNPVDRKPLKASDYWLGKTATFERRQSFRDLFLRLDCNQNKEVQLHDSQWKYGASSDEVPLQEREKERVGWPWKLLV